METPYTEPPFFATELPEGYKKLKAGDKRPKGYLFRGKSDKCGWTHGGSALVGTPINDNNLAIMEFAGPTK